ncbi:branched-chain amino acid transport system ATP-binding protein [Rhodoligotrophos appendicifer]|uniref:ABC transporter ATP-binding protein n=1 Tax=Rhodoligotrophos appendicifer TaxID=987056 RepID=UPI001186E2F9|nr:ABC transporter ATP-binding protein [Rhodoligotrophos appendicifer]
MNAIIEVTDVTKRFASLVAVDHCTLRVEQGSITGLIGPNGAGKSTLFNIIAGALAPESGTVKLAGRDVTGWSPHDLFTAGLVRTFQIPHEFSHMTTFENLMMVPSGQAGENLWSAWFRPGTVRYQEMQSRKRVEEVLAFLKLAHVKNELAGNLSGGQKKLLELGRTMMTEARVVLLDEIAAGVNRTLLQDLAANIQRLNRELGYTFLVIEHDMDLIARLCNPVIVMAQGSVMTEGPIEQIQADPRVIEAYFGGAPKRERHVA